jgi:hypothetical protein
MEKLESVPGDSRMVLNDAGFEKDFGTNDRWNGTSGPGNKPVEEAGIR